MGVGNDPRYLISDCFFPFPFPTPTDAQAERIRSLGEQLDAHRKARQAEHPKLTLTNMYNVLEKLRSGEELSKKDRTVHEQGLVSVLRELHDDLDCAVLDAYGWPLDIEEDDLLQRLVDLNAERAAEEARGLVRWLRPEFQAPDEITAPEQGELAALTGPDEDTARAAAASAAKVKPVPWPKSLSDRVKAVRGVLVDTPGALEVKSVASRFKGARGSDVAEILETLVALGQAEALGDRFAAAERA